MDFGKKFREERAKKNLTQQEVADGLGINRRMITRYENGISRPRTKSSYLKIAEFFGVDVNCFLKDDSELSGQNADQYPHCVAQQTQDLFDGITRLFACGIMSDSEKDSLMRTLQDIYWESKEHNLKKHADANINQLKDEMNTYKALLDKMEYTLIEYDISTRSIRTANDVFLSKYLNKQAHGAPITMEEIMNSPFKFDYESLQYHIDRVASFKEPQLFETEFVLDSGRTEVMEFAFAPFIDVSERVSKIIGAIKRVTTIHKNKEEAELLSYVPVGIHRCHLSNPIHLEYVSTGLCQMLGYTKEEFAELVGPDSKYSMAIIPEDRDIFRQFVQAAARQEGKYSAEYRMKKKNGDIIKVIDYMKSKRSTLGTMYGYSSVADITSSSDSKELSIANEKIKQQKRREIEMESIQKQAEKAFTEVASKLTLQNELMQEEKENLERAISAINSDYSIVCCVDLAKDIYMICETSQLLRPEPRDIAYHNHSYSIAIKNYVSSFVAHDDLPLMMAETQIDRIRERLSKENEYSIRYRIRQNEMQQTHFEMHICDCSDHAEQNTVAIGFRCLDSIILEEQERREQLQDALNESNKLGELTRELTTSAEFTSELDITEGMIHTAIIGKNGTNYLKQMKLTLPCSFDDLIERCAAMTEVYFSDIDSQNRISQKLILDAYQSGRRKLERVLYYPGRDKYFRITYYLRQDTANNHIMTFVVCQDITGEEKNRIAVQQLESSLKSAQLKNSLSQMQPHFLYNALASIQEIVLEDPEYASDLICDFSTHLRACIRAMSHNDLVPFAQELDNIKAYVNIEKMRFGDKLHVNYKIESLDFQIVPLSVQPLVENAIRHGIYERGVKGGSVTIKTTRDAEGNVIEITDDGIGFDYEKHRKAIENHETDSAGLMNVMFRLEKMMNATVKVESVIGKGTTVTIMIPYRKSEEHI